MKKLFLFLLFGNLFTTISYAKSMSDSYKKKQATSMVMGLSKFEEFQPIQNSASISYTLKAFLGTSRLKGPGDNDSDIFKIKLQSTKQQNLVLLVSCNMESQRSRVKDPMLTQVKYEYQIRLYWCSYKNESTKISKDFEVDDYRKISNHSDYHAKKYQIYSKWIDDDLRKDSSKTNSIAINDSFNRSNTKDQKYGYKRKSKRGISM